MYLNVPDAMCSCVTWAKLNLTLFMQSNTGEESRGDLQRINMVSLKDWVEHLLNKCET
jgi:hypothetical protein